MNPKSYLYLYRAAVPSETADTVSSVLHLPHDLQHVGKQSSVKVGGQSSAKAEGQSSAKVEGQSSTKVER